MRHRQRRCARRSAPSLPRHSLRWHSAAGETGSRTRSGGVGVLATPANLAGDLLRNLIERWASDVRVVSQACPSLVERIEDGELDSPSTTAPLRRYVALLLDAGANTVVIGCTHYPLLLPQLCALVGDDAHMLGIAPAVAQRVVQALQERGLTRVPTGTPGSVTYATTGDPARLADLIDRLDLPRGRVEQATLGADYADTGA